MTLHLHLHRMTGCAPTPLANYLKALGILRLVAEQVDPAARGWWQDESFCLLTRLTHEELGEFFLNSYQPTPIISPWNKGSGFYKSNDPGLSPMESSTAERFQSYRMGVADARELLDSVAHADSVIRAIKARTKTNKSFQTELQREVLTSSDTLKQTIALIEQLSEKPGISEADQKGFQEEMATIQSLIAPATKPATKAQADKLKASAGYKRVLAAAERRFKSRKATLIPDCRRSWRGPHAGWISAAVVLDEEGTPTWPSLLGTGGNDGNLDFTNNLMQRFGELFELSSPDGCCRPTARTLLRNALWSEPSNQSTSSAIGQFQPGSAGGANSSTGTDGNSLVNAWDFVLMMEGSILFSARTTRRLAPNESSRASAPFAIRAHATGYPTSGTEKAQRGEQWMPIWSQPATLPDLASLLGDARLQLGRQIANRPVDAARAISRLGVARGIDSFVRFGYLERNGQSTLAVPLGRIRVHQHPRAFLIDDLAPWLDRLQRRARDKNAPARLGLAERMLADSVLAALTHDDSPDRWQAILRNAIHVEALQATGSGIDAGPIPSLRIEWIDAIGFDCSAEVRLAVALGSAAAGYAKNGRAIDPVRHHWLPLERGGRRFKTSDKRLAKDSRVVVSGRDPIADCAAIVERRLIEAGMKGERRLKLVSPFGAAARLDDLALFLGGHIDVQRVFDLARALMAVKWDSWQRRSQTGIVHSKESPSEAWLALRLACLAWPLADGHDIPAEPSIIRRLLAGDGPGAMQRAITRLTSAGIRSPLQTAITDFPTAKLWASALVFPIDRFSAVRAVAILDPRKKVPKHA